MNRRTSGWNWLVFCALLGAAWGCAGGSRTDENPYLVVEEGKTDDYYSDLAVEYSARGTLPVRMSSAQYQDEKLRAERIQGRLTAVGLYLTAYLADKVGGVPNARYGGFHAMARNRSIQPDQIGELQDGVCQVGFSIDLAGPANLLSTLPASPEAGSQEPTVAFQMPADVSFARDSVPAAEILMFDPATHRGPMETVALHLRPNDKIENAWPEYAAFVEDGVLDATLFFGAGYAASPLLQGEASRAFEYLKKLGFDAPVRRFEDLKQDSGPLSRTLLAKGRRIRVEVRLFHPAMWKSPSLLDTLLRRTQRPIREVAVEEIAARDAFFYIGHAGPYSGLNLGEGEDEKLTEAELAGIPFAPGRKQLFFAHGCMSYSQYADALYASPGRSEADLDVITAVNYSLGVGTAMTLLQLVGPDGQGNHRPVDYGKLLGTLNALPVNAKPMTLYGVTGTAGNPRLHPYANQASLGRRCARPADCGDPNAHVCAAPEPGAERGCGILALAPAACPAGSRYRLLAEGGSITQAACF